MRGKREIKVQISQLKAQYIEVDPILNQKAVLRNGISEKRRNPIFNIQGFPICEIQGLAAYMEYHRIKQSGKLFSFSKLRDTLEKDDSLRLGKAIYINVR